jgi:hypothetical protein
MSSLDCKHFRRAVCADINARRRQAASRGSPGSNDTPPAETFTFRKQRGPSRWTTRHQD